MKKPVERLQAPLEFKDQTTSRIHVCSFQADSILGLLGVMSYLTLWP